MRAGCQLLLPLGLAGEGEQLRPLCQLCQIPWNNRGRSADQWATLEVIYRPLRWFTGRRASPALVRQPALLAPPLRALSWFCDRIFVFSGRARGLLPRSLLLLLLLQGSVVEKKSTVSEQDSLPFLDVLLSPSQPCSIRLVEHGGGGLLLLLLLSLLLLLLLLQGSWGHNSVHAQNMDHDPENWP